jgi:hypothetical protein
MKPKLDAAVERPNPERRMVAMVGATGAGKISRSLVHGPALIIVFQERVHCSTRSQTRRNWRKQYVCCGSCTSISTSYSRKLEWQRQSYAAEICYYTVEKCRKLPEELLRQYDIEVGLCERDAPSSGICHAATRRDTRQGSHPLSKCISSSFSILSRV